jgi:hypothetical protein
MYLGILLAKYFESRHNRYKKKDYQLADILRTAP